MKSPASARPPILLIEDTLSLQMVYRSILTGGRLPGRGRRHGGRRAGAVPGPATGNRAARPGAARPRRAAADAEHAGGPARTPASSRSPRMVRSTARSTRCGPGRMIFWSSPSTKAGFSARSRTRSPNAAPGPAPRSPLRPARTRQPRCPRRDRGRRLHRLVRPDGADPRHHRLGRPVDGDRLHHRRKRHRERALRAGRPRRFRPRHRPLHRAELRRDPAGPAGIRGLRPHEGQLHRRDFRQARGRRRRRRRHAVPGRDLRDGPGPADQASAVPPDLDRPARRRDPAEEGERPHRLRHQPRPASMPSAAASSARTSTTASSWCRSTCPPCATAGRT